MKKKTYKRPVSKVETALVDRESELKILANKYDATFDINLSKFFTRALDEFEISLADHGHQLSVELQKKADAKVERLKKAKEARDKKMLPLQAAQQDPQSLHSIIKLLDSSPDGIKKWNRKVADLVLCLKGNGTKFGKRVLENKCRDLVINNGWTDQEKNFANNIFAPLVTKEKKSPIQAPAQSELV